MMTVWVGFISSSCFFTYRQSHSPLFLRLILSHHFFPTHMTSHTKTHNTQDHDPLSLQPPAFVAFRIDKPIMHPVTFYQCVYARQQFCVSFDQVSSAVFPWILACFTFLCKIPLICEFSISCYTAIPVMALTQCLCILNIF